MTTKWKTEFLRGRAHTREALAVDAACDDERMAHLRHANALHELADQERGTTGALAESARHVAFADPSVAR